MTSMIFPILAAGDPLSHVVDHAILKTSGGWFILSNHMIMIVIAALLCLLIFPKITKPYQDGKLIPTGGRNFFEAIMMFLRNDVAKPLLGDNTDRFMPLLWTLFFFIWFMNLLGLLPLDAIQNLLSGGSYHAIYGTATSNWYVTVTLAVVVFVVVQFNGIKANGIGGWAHHFLGGAPWWLAPVMIPVEIGGMLIKPFALSVRLAANMTAGHILLAVVIGFVPAAWGVSNLIGGGVTLISVVSAVAIMVLELFVATLQAYLFVFLTSLFISQMISHGHDDHHADEHHGEESHGTSAKPAH
jgi:F-type H+-transporting ATPase subunit a